MSRNKEKAQSGLHRYYEQKIQDAGVISANPSNRPRKVQSVETIAEAELWRKTLLGEFSAKMSAINDPSLAEDELRDLNDAVNKIYSEKRAWEHHILSLGGNDYIRHEKKVGVRVKGKAYYGRAKELPEAQVSEKIRLPSASENAQKEDLSLAYYGILDGKSSWNETIDARKETVMAEINGALGESFFPDVEPVMTPKGDFTQKDVERWLVDRRKKELMAKLMS